MPTFTILGGGIAGLTTAIALQRIGIRAQVFEAAPEIKPLGAGLVLAANAMQSYQRLGIAEAIAARGQSFPAFDLLDQRGRLISRADAETISRKYGLHNFAIHRADLHETLLQFLEPGLVQTNKRAEKVDKSANGQTIVHFTDGTSVNSDYVLAADGIHSPIRRQLLPDSRLRYSGYTCWRAAINNLGLSLPGTSESWGVGKRFGIVPLAGNRIYWFACVNAPQNDPAMQAVRTADLQKIFAGFHQPIPDILAHTSDDQLLWNDISDLEPIRQFAFGNIVLLGDAAHATTPNLGQGACQAIEDAIVLADELAKHPNDPPGAFRAYEKRRIARTHYIVNTSWTLGKIAQTGNPWLAGLRNTLFRLIPDSVNESQLKRVLTVDF